MMGGNITCKAATEIGRSQSISSLRNSALEADGARWPGRHFMGVDPLKDRRRTGIWCPCPTGDASNLRADLRASRQTVVASALTRISIKLSYVICGLQRLTNWPVGLRGTKVGGLGC